MVTALVRRWATLAESIQGTGKRQNQDWYAFSGTGSSADPLVLAVADGHGSAAHARSALGARFAVDRFVALATEFGRAADAGHEPGGLARLMNYARNDMPRALVQSWREAALGHWSRHRPVADLGLPEPGTDEKLTLYGTTLIGAVVTPWLLTAWQIGDGDLAVVGHDGSVARPLAPAEDDLGDETESLCGPQAWRAVRTHWAPVFEEARIPRLVVLSTDGLSKSFASGDGFTEFVGGMDERLATEGFEGVREALPDWLRHASRYSGDDTTLAAALLHSYAARPQPKPEPEPASEPVPEPGPDPATAPESERKRET
ncbi:protein phosphatase 2C domain-containing protein [Streptomyces sp. NPDC057620]|uniref:protein phosphatase 2C domain-containing protein n=1 Tax=Streptomyces sp. NPDC057620 TaxID=3346185 RepID=UPI0036CA8DF0